MSSKFTSASFLLLSIALIVVGALVPEVALLAFLSGVANILTIVGYVLLAIFFISLFGFAGVLKWLVCIILFAAIHWGLGFVFGLLGLGGIVFNLISFALAIIASVAVANRLL